MPTVAQMLSQGLDRQILGVIERRAVYMVRQLEYLKAKQDARLIDAERAGWTVSRLGIVCWLNSFYQIVVSPLAASALPSSQLALGTEIPIFYGGITFDLARRANVEAMDRAFAALCRASGIGPRMLIAHRAEDLVYIISRQDSDHG
jgi:hypothetical protein